MAEKPIITRFEFTEFEYTLQNMTRDYNGFNLVYQKGSTITGRQSVMQVHTSVGITGELLSGMPHTLPTLAPYLIGKNALERERIYQDTKRALRQQARMGIAQVDIALWDIAGKYYNAPVWGCWAGTSGRCRATPARPTATTTAVSTAPRPMPISPSSAWRWVTPPSRSTAGATRWWTSRWPTSTPWASAWAARWT